MRPSAIINDGRMSAEAEQLYRTILKVARQATLSRIMGSGCFAALRAGCRKPSTIIGRQSPCGPISLTRYINLGTAVLALGQPEEALALYQRAIEISPENALAHGNLGKALQDLGRIGEAIEAYRVAIALAPDDATVHSYNLGAALLERQAWEDSIDGNETSHRTSTGQRDGTRQSRNGVDASRPPRRGLGCLPWRMRIAAGRRRDPRQPGWCDAGTWGVARGSGPVSSGHRPRPGTVQRAHFNLSHALKAMNRLDEAALAARQAIALCPDSAEYHFHLAHLLLLRGDLAEGWQEYDWRWKLPDFTGVSRLHGPFSQPLWTGEDIGDKTLLVYTEQGLGDIILFARYLPLAVLAREARVIVAGASVDASTAAIDRGNHRRIGP